MNDAFYTVDIHAHLLPGLDDGPAKMDDALRMCELYVAQGVGAVVATPHMGDSRYDVSPSRVRAALESLRGECTRQGLGLTLLAGADVRLGPDTLGRLDAGDVLTLADRGEHLLLEMPGGALPPLNGFLAELERRGLTAVISHPERHPEFRRRPRRLAELSRAGCLVQVTAGSLLGRFGKEARAAALGFIKEGIVNLVAGDAHRPRGRRAPAMHDALREVARRFGTGTARRLFRETPEMIAGSLRAQPAGADGQGGEKGAVFYMERPWQA